MGEGVPMQVSEERLGELLADDALPLPSDPVTRLAVGSLTRDDPIRANDQLRAAGSLAHLLDPTGSHPIDPEIALRTLADVQRMDDRRIEAELAACAAEDELLGIAIHALKAGPVGAPRGDAHLRQARCRALYLTLSMLQAQQEVDVLDQALAG